MTEKYKLDDICDFVNGGAWSDKEYTHEGIPVLKVSNFKPNGFEIENPSYLSVDALKTYEKNLLTVNDLVIATVGSHPNLTNSAAGRSCIIPESISGFLLNQNAVCVKSKDEDVLCQKYLCYLGQTHEFKYYIQSRGKGAANQMRIAIGAIKDYEVILPSILTQRRIAEILSAYDDLIENNQKQIKLLEEAAMLLYKEWFVKLRFPGHENTKIVDGLPEGWQKRKLFEIANIVMGQSPSSKYYNNDKKGLPFHQGVTGYGFRYITDTGYSSEFTRSVKENSILFSVRAPVGRINVTKNEIAIGRGLAGIFHKNGYNSYLLYLLKERFYKDDIMGNGAIFASITKSDLENILFVTGNESIVSKFNEIVIDYDEKILALDTQINQARAARDKLLPKLINGEIEVL